MKKTLILQLLLSILSLVFSSCSTDDDDSIKLLTKRITTADNGSSSIEIYTYKDNLITSIDGPISHTDFTYTDDLITKVTTLDKAGQLLETLIFNYVAGNLVRVESVNSYEINYIHNPDNTVSYQKIEIKAGNSDNIIFHGTLYFQNDNLIKDERILDNVSSGALSKIIFEFDYDTKRNPLYNITGFRKILHLDEDVAANNNVSITVTTSISLDNQITSSLSFSKNTFNYDQDNYPAEKFTENGKNGILKTEYFY